MGSLSPAVSGITCKSVKKPALFLRKVSHVPSKAVHELLVAHGAKKVQIMTYKTELAPADMAVAYFDSEGDALLAMVGLFFLCLFVYLL